MYHFHMTTPFVTLPLNNAVCIRLLHRTYLPIPTAPVVSSALNPNSNVSCYVPIALLTLDHLLYKFARFCQVPDQKEIEVWSYYQQLASKIPCQTILAGRDPLLGDCYYLFYACIQRGRHLKFRL